MSDLQGALDRSLQRASSFTRSLFADGSWDALRVEEFINTARNITIATVTKSGSPHAAVVIAACLDGEIHLTVAPASLLSRNLAITGAAEGLVVFDAALIRASSIRVDSPIRRLSRRQREIVELIAQGYSNKAIAQRLVLTEKSVENHLTRIYQQLGISASDPATHQRVQIALLYWDSTVGNRALRP